MHISRESSLRPALVLLAAFAAAPLAAQLQVQAYYPLISDLNDATNTYGPVMLTGQSTPPSPPANGVCVNGIYFYNTNGQDVRTPLITSLNTNDLQVDVEFQIAALPAVRAPVFMCGHSYRWLGIYVDANGTIGFKHNNSNHAWSSTTVTTGNWYLGSLRYENGVCELHLNGRMVLQVQVGPLNTSTNLNFTTNDFSNGLSHNGCIRNVVISNDTTLGRVASATVYGTGCDGLRMRASGTPQLGNPLFALAVDNVSAASPLAFLGLGTGLVDPGIDLTPAGMPGCFSYTNLDIGLFGIAVVAGGTGSFPIPIPNLPSLTGMVLYAQGSALTTTTPLGLAASNGVQMVVGL